MMLPQHGSLYVLWLSNVLCKKSCNSTCAFGRLLNHGNSCAGAACRLHSSLCRSGERTTTDYYTSQLRRELNRAMHAMVVTVFEMFIPGYTLSHPASSCKEILQLAPQSTSGLYWIRGTDNRPRQMYWDMERSCKGVAGGWMKVASIDMTDTSSTCPSGLRTLTSPRRLCAMNIDGIGCSSALLPVHGVEYSQVCGKIIGYQDKTANASKVAMKESTPPMLMESA